MSEQNENEEQPAEVTRLTMSEFLTQLDTAKDWMLWVNPMIGEIQLIVKDADDKMEVFQGPEPLSVEAEEYLAFSLEVEKMADKKK